MKLFPVTSEFFAYKHNNTFCYQKKIIINFLLTCRWNCELTGSRAQYLYGFSAGEV